MPFVSLLKRHATLNRCQFQPCSNSPREVADAPSEESVLPSAPVNCPTSHSWPSELTRSCVFKTGHGKASSDPKISGRPRLWHILHHPHKGGPLGIGADPLLSHQEWPHSISLSGQAPLNSLVCPNLVAWLPGWVATVPQSRFLIV